jgi:hypothetical protein
MAEIKRLVSRKRKLKKQILETEAKTFRLRRQKRVI